MKQISYKLENKVVELTQSLGSMRTENRALKGQVQNYESQLKSWRDRNTALEARTNELQREANQAGITAAKLNAMEQDMACACRPASRTASRACGRLQDEEKTLRRSLKNTSQELRAY